jgi:hypothetical protein
MLILFRKSKSPRDFIHVSSPKFGAYVTRQALFMQRYLKCFADVHCCAITSNWALGATASSAGDAGNQYARVHTALVRSLLPVTTLRVAVCFPEYQLNSLQPQAAESVLTLTICVVRPPAVDVRSGSNIGFGACNQALHDQGNTIKRVELHATFVI